MQGQLYELLWLWSGIRNVTLTPGHIQDSSSSFQVPTQPQQLSPLALYDPVMEETSGVSTVPSGGSRGGSQL